MTNAIPVQTVTTRTSKRVWAGRILTVLPILLLLFSAGVKLASSPEARQSFVTLGYPEWVIMPIGLLELGCTLIYLVPATSRLGAVLLTGYLGGAISTHLRVGDPWFSHTLFPVYIGVLLWAGLYLRRPELFGKTVRESL